ESLARSAMVDAADIAGMNLGDRHIMAAPMFHLAGLANTLMGLARGAELHLRAAFDPATCLDDIERLEVSYMTTVPAMLQAMVAEAERRDEPPDTTSVKEITYGASPIAPELVREVSELFRHAGLRQFYGMTEVAGALTALTPADHDPSSGHHLSAGRVHPGYEVRLVDRDGSDVPDGEPGEIVVRGRSLFDGYWNDPVATEEAFTDGWFATGDIATSDAGYLTIMDRAKDMIVSGGENVYPAEVEAVLYEHEAVAEAAVIGVPDDRFGERVHAVLVMAGHAAGANASAEPDLGAVQAFCRSRLAGYKLPRSIEIVEALPRNATGKVLKRDLRAPHWEGHARQV
ncbi:MAG: class I adenylate-forming enzyme family protein, partial [Acidimicrobiales bacterium]